MTESRFETVLTQAFHEYVDEKLENNSCNIEEFKTSEKFEKNIKRMIKNKGNIYYRLTFTRGRRLLCACIMIILLLISLFSVSAARELINNFIIEHFSNHDSITYSESSEIKKYPYKIEKFYVPSYIPKGYTLADKSIIDNDATYTYLGENKAIVFIQHTKEGWGASVDNEKSNATVETINGQDYYINYSDELGSTIIWDNGEYLFSLSAELPKDTMLNMCKSLKIKE